MNKDNQDTKRRETTDEFCKRLGIKQIKQKGGVELTPYHGGHHSTKKPKQSDHV